MATQIDPKSSEAPWRALGVRKNKLPGQRFGFDRSEGKWQLQPRKFGRPTGGQGVAKPEWGKKRTCQSCGALFYDMTKNPAACPKCGTADNLQPLLKPRRTPVAAPKPVPKPVKAEKKSDDDEVPGDIEDVEVDDDEDEDLIVDASDLDDDDDDDDVSEVKEHIEVDGDKD